MAILLPALGQARAVGKKAACMSNTKQLVSALSMYESDNDGWLGYSEYHGAGKYCVTSAGILYSYIHSLIRVTNYLTVGVCPAVSTAAPAGYERWGLGANRYVMSDNWYTGYQKIAKCKAPSRTAVFGDSYTAAETYKGITNIWMNPIAYSSLQSAEFTRHLKKGNFVFLDGHAESITMQDSLDKGMSTKSFGRGGGTWGFLPTAGF